MTEDSVVDEPDVPNVIEEPRDKKTFWMSVAICLIGLFMLTMGLENHLEEQGNERRDDAQRECLAENFEKLTDALETRAELTTETNDLRDRQRALLADRIENVTTLISSALGAGPGDDPNLLSDFIEDTNTFELRTEQLQRDIEEAKARQEKVHIPPYPEGTCDQ